LIVIELDVVEEEGCFPRLLLKKVLGQRRGLMRLIGVAPHDRDLLVGALWIDNSGCMPAGAAADYNQTSAHMSRAFPDVASLNQWIT